MRSILDATVYWTAGILITTFLLVITRRLIRLLLPTFRPSYIRAMWNADLPKGEEIRIGIPGFNLTFHFSKPAETNPVRADRHETPGMPTD